MASLAILQPDARAAARLTAALSGEHEVSVYPTWEALQTRLAGGDLEGCLLDTDRRGRAKAAKEILGVRREYPGLAMVALVEPDNALEYYDLGELGVDGVLAGSSQPTEVRAVMQRALASSLATSIEAALTDRLQSPGPEAVAWAVQHAGPDATVGRFSEAMGHSPRGLRRALRAVGLPTPSRVLLWGRLLLASARLGRDSQPLEEVAFSLGYSTAGSLSRAIKRHTRLTPGQISKVGVVDRVLEALLSAASLERGAGRGLRGMALLVAVAAQASCAAAVGGVPSGMRAEVDRLLDAPPLDQVHFGVLAVDARTGRTLYARNAHQKFVPASNQKILLTHAALSLLGPDYRYRTEVWAVGSRDGGSLDGDLVVVAMGDPSLSRRYWPSGAAALGVLADSIRATGLERVTGSVFVDVSAWDSTTVGPTWEAADLPEAYAATGGAFSIDDGELEVVVRGGAAVGSSADVTWSPAVSEDYVLAQIVTSPPDSATRIHASYLPQSRRLVLDGTVAAGGSDTLALAVRDPVRQAASVLGSVFEGAGIALEGGVEVLWEGGFWSDRDCAAAAVGTCAGATLLSAFDSPPLHELVAAILGTSQNWMAEQLVKTLGAELAGFGGWEEGLDLVERFLVEEVGIDSLDISSRDGSGLSRYNLTTPRALVRVLRHASRAPWGRAYRSAMAEPAEPDTTLEERLLDLGDRLFAKTGTLSNVNSLSGYLVRSDGAEVVFSILSNGSGLPAQLVTDAIDDVVRVLAR